VTSAALEVDPTRFLFKEARLLDDFNLDGWLQLLDQKIEYTAPVRQTVNILDGSGISRRAFYFNEDYGSLALRIKKLNSEYSWSENPRTRTRRMISNIEVIGDAQPDGRRLIDVTSNIAIFCHRGDEPQPKIITGQRLDTLCIGAETKILRRKVLLDTTVLGVASLSVFL
jgi:3-phenylpropionate/cinnamic acid dioxygenase small subunit